MATSAFLFSSSSLLIRDVHVPSEVPLVAIMSSMKGENVFIRRATAEIEPFEGSQRPT